MTDLTVAKTILTQMGGNMAMKMIGGYNMVGESNALSFKFKAKARESMNFCKVTLTPMDEYDFELGRVRGATYTKVFSVEGIYCDQLIEIFERETGLYLKLFACH